MRGHLPQIAAGSVLAALLSGCAIPQSAPAASSTHRQHAERRHHRHRGHRKRHHGPRHHSPTPLAGMVVTGRGWTAAGIEGHVPAPGACHYRHLGDGEVGPDPRCTPGAIDRGVTPANLDSTICRHGGYTDSVRPPESLTEPLKYKLLAAYGVPASRVGGYELDHLVDLANGGSSAVENLWPEPDHDGDHYSRSAFVHNDKDHVEDDAYYAVCDHRIALHAAQRGIARNWVRLAVRLGHPL